MADTTVTPDTPAWEGTNHVEELEQRLQKLEDVVAAICDTQTLEDKVYQRVTDRLVSERPAPAAPQAPPQDELPPHPSEAEIAPPKPPTATFVPPAAPPAASWLTELTLIGDMWFDVRSFWRMLRDPLYPTSKLAKFVVIAPLAYLTWTMLFGFHQGILGSFVGYVVDAVLFVPFLYLTIKVWARELRRYRDFAARYGRA
jgi:hypothetical protein